MPGDWLTLAMVAANLGKSEKTISRRVHDGSLVAREIDGRPMVHRSELDRYRASLGLGPSGPDGARAAEAFATAEAELDRLREVLDLLRRLVATGEAVESNPERKDTG